VKFRAYFEQRTGEPWPKLGDVGPGGESITVMMFEVIADYLDELGGAPEVRTLTALIERWPAPD
jgi:hypothetical protein